LDTGVFKFLTEIDEETKSAIHVIVKAYQKQIKNSIEEVLKTSIPNIDNQEFTGILKHEGAGGTTYILQVNFTAGSKKITGGLVVKFAKDLEEETRNAANLSKILKARAVEWKKKPPQKPLPDWLPQIVFSPKVLGSHPKRNVLILEFIGGGIPLLKTDFSEEEKYQILGYALGRLHGSEAYETAMILYEPMFKLLESFMPDQGNVINFWKNILEQSKGGCKFIHGDSHLENLLYSKTSHGLAWIDALLVPQGDRMDDVAYTISHIVQEQIIDQLESNPNESSKKVLAEVLTKIVRSIVPQILSTYMRTANLKGLYKDVIPIDFFLGFHLINRTQLFGESKISNILDTLGRELIISRPLGQLLGLEKSS
jgi:tRNA A-37 threonylcarbamoyl transferase component Bud32